MNLECKGFELIHQINGEDAIITYFLESFDEDIARYGIYVEKEIEGEISEKERTGGVVEDRDEAESMLNLLMRNQITPCVLNEVVYDVLTERISR